MLRLSADMPAPLDVRYNIHWSMGLGVKLIKNALVMTASGGFSHAETTEGWHETVTVDAGCTELVFGAQG